MKDLEVIGNKDFIPTPRGLTNKERVIFEKIVVSFSPSHFTLGEQDLLKNYAMNFVLLEEYNKQLRKAPILSREHKQVLQMITSLNSTQATLSQKLRVNPSSRMGNVKDVKALNDNKFEDDEFGDLV